MAKGTLVLKTEGGERKMSYSLVGDIYYMATKANSNKVAQIKANDQVTIDLNDTTFTATLIAKEDAEYQAKETIYLSTMPKFQKFIYKNLFGKKNDMLIILNETK